MEISLTQLFSRLSKESADDVRDDMTMLTSVKNETDL